MTSPTRRNKGNARKSPYKGTLYDSKLEADYAAHLDLLRAAGEVLIWHYHPQRWALVINEKHVGYYTPDFLVVRTNQHDSYFVDCKGWVPREWPFRLKVIRACHPGADLRIVTREDF